MTDDVRAALIKEIERIVGLSLALRRRRKILRRALDDLDRSVIIQPEGASGRKAAPLRDGLIRLLAESGEPLTTHQISETLGQARGATAVMLSRLKDKGLVFLPGGKGNGWALRRAPAKTIELQERHNA